MMREGTTTRTTQQISELLETKAATVAVTSGLSSTTATVTGSSLTENFEDTFALAADILLNPSFPADELDRYRTRTRAGLVPQRTSPGFLANEMMSKILYGTHPGVAHLAHRRGADEDHARRAGLDPPHALRARSRHHRHRRRHLDGRGAQD